MQDAKEGYWMPDAEFDKEMTEISGLAHAHIEAMRVDQQEWEAEMVELADLADQMPDAIKACDNVEALRRVGELSCHPTR